MLDCGEYFSAGRLNAFNGVLLDMNKLMTRQAAWLKHIRNTPEFRNARFRVVMAHGEPMVSKNVFNNNIRNLALDLLRDDSDNGRIHLWLAGHCHRYWRAARGSKSLVSRIEPKGSAALAAAPVNFLTCDGPKGNAASPDFSYISVKCTPEKLHIKAIDDKGRKFDEFEIDQQGKLKTLYLDKELKDYLLPEK